jgi:hypothetical protein
MAIWTMPWMHRPLRALWRITLVTLVLATWQRTALVTQKRAWPDMPKQLETKLLVVPILSPMREASLFAKILTMSPTARKRLRTIAIVLSELAPTPPTKS